MDQELVDKSKFLSYILRHNPQQIDLQLDRNGWASIDDLLKKSRDSGININYQSLEAIAKESTKKRFSISDNGQFIRANYGHSIDIDLDLKAVKPPRHLFHGTAEQFLDSIHKTGITCQDRNFVHLSTDRESALEVGQRHGTPVILKIEAARMYDQEYQFFHSQAGIWLTKTVPTAFIRK